MPTLEEQFEKINKKFKEIDETYNYDLSRIGRTTLEFMKIGGLVDRYFLATLFEKKFSPLHRLSGGGLLLSKYATYSLLVKAIYDCIF